MATVIVCFLVYRFRGWLTPDWAERLFTVAIILLAMSIDADFIIQIIHALREGD